MEWSWKASEDESIEEGVITLKFSTCDLKIKLENFGDACGLVNSINAELKIKEAVGIQSVITNAKSMLNEF